MNCKRCGSKLYEGVPKCAICGFSEKDEIEKVDKKMVKRKMKYIVGILLLFYLFFHFFLYIDIPNGCFVKIRPAMTELSNTSIKKGIRFLKKGYPKQYADFCSNVSTIDPNISCGGFGGGCYSEYHSSPRVIDVSTTYGDWQSAAKVIIHETCHAIQRKEKRPFDEGECYGKDSIIPWRSRAKLEY